MASGLSTKLDPSKGVPIVQDTVVGDSLANTPLQPRHLVSVNDVNKASLMKLIQEAELLRTLPRHEVQQKLRGKLVATLFYEPSTRTRMSFEAAVLRLGGHVVGAENALENSSAKKGESLEDVFQVVGSYVDAIVIRHHETDTVAKASHCSPVPIVSAGTGAGEHPTQAMLDVYTIWRELGRVDNLRVMVCGDLRYGRTVHSLLRILSWFEGIEVTLFAPEHLALPSALQEELSRAGMVVLQGRDFHQALATTDIVYQTRVQAERFATHSDNTEPPFVIGPLEVSVMPEHARILHPLPRVNEISIEVDQDPRAAYFRQVENGLYMRMALLDELLRGMNGAASD